ncbi:MAG: hypothetical protein GWP61_00215 [Chloroflexi bacterium]|jgi:hypothetical protein|nr:hypothetical protein [Chloroflexota bacterium]
MQRIFVHVSITRLCAATILALAIFLAALVGTTSANENGKLSDLWIDLSLGPPLVELFNERAQADDVARVEHISQLDLLQEVTAGQKLVVFKSAEDAIRLLPHIHEEIDIVGYNLEHGPANPKNEQENPVESIRRLRQVADEYDLAVALGPDHDFAISHAAAMAPYADYIILQIQKVQTEPDTVYDFVLPVLADVRQASPDIKTSVQIRTEGDVDKLLDMLEPLQDEIDGISILTSGETISVTEEIMEELRAEPIVPTPEPVEADEAPAGAAPAIDDIGSDDEVLPATIVAAVLNSEENPEQESTSSIADSGQENGEASSASRGQDGTETNRASEPLSTPESNQRTGSNWLFVAIALIAGFALGAGYFHYRASK